MPTVKLTQSFVQGAVQRCQTLLSRQRLQISGVGVTQEQQTVLLHPTSEWTPDK